MQHQQVNSIFDTHHKQMIKHEKLSIDMISKNDKLIMEVAGRGGRKWSNTDVHKLDLWFVDSVVSFLFLSRALKDWLFLISDDWSILKYWCFLIVCRLVVFVICWYCRGETTQKNQQCKITNDARTHKSKMNNETHAPIQLSNGMQNQQMTNKWILK